MPHTITPASTWHSTIPALSDGDPVAAGSSDPTTQQLADNSQYIYTTVGINGSGNLVKTASAVNTSPITYTGNGTGAGGVFTGGASGHGLIATGGGSGKDGIQATAGTGGVAGQAAVRGVNPNSTSQTYGVYGQGATGVYGYNNSLTGTGVVGQSDGIGGQGVSGQAGIDTGGNIGAGVVGYNNIVNNCGYGLKGVVNGTPKNAPLFLTPSAQPSGANDKGALYVDSSGILYICTASGTPGTWTKVGAQ